jgi:hypothetical protein
VKVTPWSGEPISEPGVYSGVPMAIYHEQLTVAPSVSSGGLRTIENRSCAHYFVDSYLNPDRAPREDTDAFAMGRAVHELAGGEAGFWSRYALRPDTYEDEKGGEKPWSGNANACKAWLAAQKLAGRAILTKAQLADIRGMCAALERHPAVGEGILHGLVEHSLVWRDQATGVWLKARPDVIPVDCDMVVDLKTCVSADHQSCCRAITDHGYHMQLALVYEGLVALTGRRVTDFVLVFVEKSPPYAVGVKLLDFTDLEYGRRQLRRSIDKFARCVERAEWPTYEDEDVPATLLPFYRKRLADEAEQRLLPTLEPLPEQLEPAE